MNHAAGSREDPLVILNSPGEEGQPPCGRSYRGRGAAPRLARLHAVALPELGSAGPIIAPEKQRPIHGSGDGQGYFGWLARLQSSRTDQSGTLGNSRVNLTFTHRGIQQIAAHLGAGNDSLIVDRNVGAALIVDAGAGNDRVIAGGGPSILVGGFGNDVLTGGKGRDVLIGGGGDQLSGGGGSDLLIAGRTSYDDNAAALAAILAEWTSSRTLRDRAANLRTSGGSVLAGQAIHLTIDETVFDDSDVDQLMGGGDLDWFFYDATKDKLRDKRAGELVN